MRVRDPAAHHTAPASIRRPRGYSQLELLVAITLVAVFAAVLLNRLAFYQEAAEKAKVEYTISLLKSALRIRMATMMADGQSAGYASLEQRNPMDWLEEKPVGYSSVTANHASSEKFSGAWHFDPADRTLTYWPVRKAYLQADRSGQKRIRMKVTLVRNDDGAAPGAGEHRRPENAPIVSVRLHVEPYQWF